MNEGRNRKIFPIRSKNIYPVDVEQVVHSNPKILEAAVIGFLDDKWSEAVGATVILKEGQMTQGGLID